MNIDNKVLLKTAHRTVVRNIDDILYIRADGSYSTLNFIDGDCFTISKNLSRLKFPAEYFVRIHASIVINVNYIKRIEDNTVTLENDQELPIAKRRRKVFFAILNDRFNNL